MPVEPRSLGLACNVGKRGLNHTAEGESYGPKRCMCPEGSAPCLEPTVLGDILKVCLIYIHVTDLKILQWLKMLEPK